MSYAELQVTSNFSFLRGGSHARELIAQAVALGLSAIAVTDRNTLAGVVRAHTAARGQPIKLVIGCRLDLRCGNSLLCWPTNRQAYARLSKLLTIGKTTRGAPKGECWLDFNDICQNSDGQLFAAIPPEVPDENFIRFLGECRDAFGNALSVAACHYYRGDDNARLRKLAGYGIPLVATNDVHYHIPERKPLQDVLTCIREKCTIQEAGFKLFANAERHIKPPFEMQRLFSKYPEAIARGVEIAKACAFSLDELKYEYPDEITSQGRSPAEELAHLTWEGARARYGNYIPEKVRKAIDHELSLINQLGYEPYFLTVQDIVRFAEREGILCQGRGSAANSAVCYCLGVTAVDPMMTDLLFERFISTARNEPPDMDVDFEHERREEVFQYIYNKYSRNRAGIVATVICYRPRSAITDVGKALGLSIDTVRRLGGSIWGYAEEINDDRIREQGLDPGDPTLQMAIYFTYELFGFPRHLSQHTGGFVMTRGPLAELCPIMDASMEDRTQIEWDKDDIDALGILKVDVLALGMLTCIHRAFDFIRLNYGKQLTLWNVPKEDPAVYEMLSRADSLGVFQVESRAQMNMLPRLRPNKFYDLVIEVAIVRPGPIQGDMVHPYLRRRYGNEIVTYPSKELEAVLSRTLGVPLFQEQAMRIAIVAAGFTPDEADKLRRAMATFKKVDILNTMRDQMIEGMVKNGYERDYAERCFKQIEGFGTYGFPESHAASFALLVYISAWIKCHYPDVFAASLLNSYPMGFYKPAQIVRDARDHGVEVREADINYSQWDCTLEASKAGPYAVRLGMRQTKSIKAKVVEKLLACRGNGFTDLHSINRKTKFGKKELEPLANADAFRSIGLDRRKALWGIKGLEADALPLFDSFEETDDNSGDALPVMRLGEHIAEDYSSLTLSLKGHPMSFIKPLLHSKFPLVAASKLRNQPNDKMVSVAGLVLFRQAPGTAKGIMFITIEDETGSINLVVYPNMYDANRAAILGGRVLQVDGLLEKAGEPGFEVIHIIAKRITDISHELNILTEFVPQAHNTSETGSARMIPSARSFR